MLAFAPPPSNLNLFYRRRACRPYSVLRTDRQTAADQAKSRAKLPIETGLVALNDAPEGRQQEQLPETNAQQLLQLLQLLLLLAPKKQRAIP